MRLYLQWDCMYNETVYTFLIQNLTTSGFVQDTLHARTLQVGVRNYVTSQLLFIVGFICVHPISQISKTCIAFHLIPQTCSVSNLLMFFIWLTSCSIQMIRPPIPAQVHELGYFVEGTGISVFHNHHFFSKT